MTQINFDRIFSDFLLDPFEVAMVMFPQNRSPQRALSRVISGDAELTEVQILRLIALTGMSYEKLCRCESWAIDPSRGKSVVFSRGEHTVIFEPATMRLLVFHGNDLGHSEIWAAPTVSVSDLIARIDEIIKSKKDKL